MLSQIDASHTQFCRIKRTEIMVHSTRWREAYRVRKRQDIRSSFFACCSARRFHEWLVAFVASTFVRSISGRYYYRPNRQEGYLSTALSYHCWLSHPPHCCVTTRRWYPHALTYSRFVAIATPSPPLSPSKTSCCTSCSAAAARRQDRVHDVETTLQVRRAFVPLDKKQYRNAPCHVIAHSRPVGPSFDNKRGPNT